MYNKILAWNINQATQRNQTPPPLVTEALKKQQAVIEILTEFCFCRNEEQSAKFLKETFTDRGYAYYPEAPTQNSQNGQNEVLIAWDTSCFELVPDSQYSAVTTGTNNIPNFVTVELKEISSGKLIRVAGVRITVNSTSVQRRQQMEFIYQKLDDLTNEHTAVLIAGDFNNYWRKAVKTEEWNFQAITCDRTEYTRHTPTGQSIYEKVKPLANQFAEDHFITNSQCKIYNYRYDRQFVQLDQDKAIYKYGENFAYYCHARTYVQNGKSKTDWVYKWNMWNTRYPDHAMLIGELTIL